MRLTVKAPAKINLTLDITGKRPDGYHDICTIMHSVALSDTVRLTAEKSGTPSVRVKTDKAYIPCGPSNTVFKAATLFIEKTGIGAAVEIDINKKIPVGAGLGGGSSDAAATLKALNSLLGANLSAEELNGLAARVGADVPFCLEGGCALARGIGELLTPLPQLPAAPVVICKPKGGVSTARVFGALRADKIALRPDTDAAVRAIEAGDIAALSRCCCNVLTEVTLKFKPVISAIKRELMLHGALCAEMSGSGSAVFALFTDFHTAKTAAEAARKKYAEVYLTALGAE